MNQSTTRAFRSRVGMRTILATALLALCARIAPAIAHSNQAAAAFAPWLGVWSLNIAKSDFGKAVPQRSGTIIFKAAGSDHIRLLIDGAEPDGKQSHAEVTFTPDGAECPIEDWYPGTTISLKNLGRRIKWTIKLSGEIVDQTLITMASDRRSFSFRSQYVEHVKPIYSVRVYQRG
jgi:hypothetical protein